MARRGRECSLWVVFILIPDLSFLHLMPASLLLDSQNAAWNSSNLGAIQIDIAQGSDKIEQAL
jgi:hypothetical protein